MKSLLSLLSLVFILSACNTSGEEKADTIKKVEEKADTIKKVEEKWDLANMPRPEAQISKVDFQKLYTTNQDQLGQSCSMPASTYCGKTTKDLQISESDFSCLWKKVYRVTRQRLPQLDNGPCSEMIKGFAKK